MIKKTTCALGVPLLLILIALVVPAQAATYYANSLKYSASLSSDFTNHSGYDGRGDPFSTDPAFLSDPVYGLQLTSTGYTEYTGVQTYKNDLSVDQDWIVTVEAKLEDHFHPADLPAPKDWSFYNCGLDLAKKGGDPWSTSSNRINILLFVDSDRRHGIESAIYKNDGTLNGNPYSLNDLPRSNSIYWLKLQYSSATKSASTSYSTDGINYTNYGSYNLADIWELQTSDQLVLSLTGSAYQDLGPITNGQISLSNLTIQSVPNPIATPTTVTTTAPAPIVSSGGGRGGSVSKKKSAKKSSVKKPATKKKTAKKRK